METMNKSVAEITMAYKGGVCEDEVREMMRNYLSRTLMDKGEVECGVQLRATSCYPHIVQTIWEQECEGIIWFNLDTDIYAEFDDIATTDLLAIVQSL